MSTPIYMHPATIKSFNDAGVALPNNVLASESLPVREEPRVTSEKVAEVLRKLWGMP